MCSRVGFYSGDKFVTDMNTLIDSFSSNLEFTPSYNITPSQPIATVLNNGSYQYTHFGLIPNWATDKKRIQVNARSESVDEKVMFKDSIKTKRCIIPVNGFYEWSHQGSSKTPY